MFEVALAALFAILVPGCVRDDRNRDYGNKWSRYINNRPNLKYGNYNADRYHRDDPRFRKRRLSRKEQVYRGQDGRYYCRQPDGATGLIVGAIAGGVFGNLIAPGGSEQFGTIHGTIGEGFTGRQIGQDQGVRCR